MAMAIALTRNSVYAYTNLDEVQVFLSGANLVDRGDYSSATAYVVGNVVTYSDALYFCVAANTNEAPSGNLSDYWSSLVLVRSGSGTSAVTAQEAYDLAEEAYTIAVNGTTLIQLLDDRLDAEIQARIHGDGTTFWNGTAYADSLFAGVSPQAGSNFTYSLYLQGTSYTDQQIASAISNVQSPDYGNRLISGGRVVWLEDYNFRVAPSVVSFAGTAVTFAGTDVTLAPSDAALDRIDLIVADNSYGTVGVIQGDVSTPPAPPNYDPIDQFQITFIPVQAASSQPVVERIWIYRENTEWTTTDSGATINPDSTNNPFQGSKDVEGTNTVQNNFVRFQSPTVLDVTNYDLVYLYIRPKASWGTSRSFRFNWETAGGVRVGDYYSVRNGVLGWQSATQEYQLVAIPISMFNVPAGQPVQALRITQIGSGTAPGFYLDDVALQAGIPEPTDQVLPIATTTVKGIVELAQNGESAANVVVQGNDYRLALGAAGTLAAAQAAQNGSAYAYSLYLAGTNYTDQEIASVVAGGNGSEFAYNLYLTGTNYTNSRTPDATTTVKGLVELAENGETAAGVAVQGNDYRLALAIAGTNADAIAQQNGSEFAYNLYLQGTNYTNAQIAAVSVNNSGSAYAFGLYTTGTNYTQQQVQNGSSYAFTLFVAGTNYANGLVGGGGGDHVVAGQNIALTELGAGTKSIAVERITTNTVDWVGPSVGAIGNQTYAGTVVIDFGSAAYKTISLTGNLHMQFTNMSAGRGVSVRLLADSTLRSLTFDGSVRFLGTYPTEIEANKVGVASFCAYGANASDIVGVFAAEA